MKEQLTKENIQQRINKLYIDKFNKYEGGFGLSIPLIPRISSKYLENRTVIVGQETNTWYRKTNDDLKNIFLTNNDLTNICLTQRYDKFINENVKNYGGKFWDFNRLLYKKKILNDKIVSEKELSHCWLNLFSVEACKDKKDNQGRPTKNKLLANKIINLQGNLLYQVFEIIRPKLIVFLTGHSLDSYLFKTAICSSNVELKQIDKNNILDKNMLAKIIVKDNTNILLNTKIIRSYHPTYFMARINVFKKMSEKIKKKNIKLTNSKYYTMTIIESLK